MSLWSYISFFPGVRGPPISGPVSSSTFNEEDNESENIDDAPTLVFGEFNQDNKLELESDSEPDEVPAFIRRQNQ